VDKTDEKNGKEWEICEVVWCNHLTVTPSPLTLVSTPHVYLHGQKCYLVVEQNKVKLVCPNCWWISTRTHQPALL